MENINNNNKDKKVMTEVEETEVKKDGVIDAVETEETADNEVNAEKAEAVEVEKETYEEPLAEAEEETTDEEVKEENNIIANHQEEGIGESVEEAKPVEAKKEKKAKKDKQVKETKSQGTGVWGKKYVRVITYVLVAVILCGGVFLISNGYTVNQGYTVVKNTVTGTTLEDKIPKQELELSSQQLTQMSNGQFICTTTTKGNTLTIEYVYTKDVSDKDIKVVKENAKKQTDALKENMTFSLNQIKQKTSIYNAKIHLVLKTNKGKVVHEITIK